MNGSDGPLEAGWIDACMQRALAAAAEAAAAGDVPVGAVVASLHDGTVLAVAANERERRADPTAHAEVLALRDAAAALGRWRLDDCVLVVTLEPCPMCAGALVGARIGGVVFAADDPKAGATGTVYNLAADPRLNHEFPVRRGVRGAEAAEQLRQFFDARRA